MNKEQLREIEQKYDMWADDYNLDPIGVCKSRPYRFSIEEWGEIKERGYVE